MKPIMMILFAAFLASAMLIPSTSNAQDERVAKLMAALKDEEAKLGAPNIKGKDPVGGKDAPALYFGSTKMNNNFTVFDKVVGPSGSGNYADLYVKAGDKYIMVTSNLEKHPRGGMCCAVGGILDDGPAIDAINAGKPFYKEQQMGWQLGYEPIKDGSGAVIGIYSVEYQK